MSPVLNLETEERDSHPPVAGSMVRIAGKDDIGMVLESPSPANGESQMSVVRWIRGMSTEALPSSKLRSGFQQGWEIQDVPHSRVRVTLGAGIVVATRCIGGRDQVLVHLYESSELRWLPFQNLRRIRGVRERFLAGKVGQAGHGERFRLKTLGFALERWNANTGSLSHLDVDPLPHQIHLVHHILASGNLNWLIADDVGLGKTIETGMLISALRQRGQCERVLLITPAGVTRQWQEELSSKFGMDDFHIFGRDFEIHDSERWKLHDRVITSMDRLKTDHNFRQLEDSGVTWDLIVFDEAHRLTRRQRGRKYDDSQRFDLAARLRDKTDSLILLTGTPHQGRSDQFAALLELLRPEWAELFQRIDVEPDVLGELVYRNRKIDVTDADGEFVFKGKTTISIPLETNDEERDFDLALQRYLRAGYEAAEGGGNQARAIGFVMTVYRKLAASSIAAIAGALSRRLARLHSASFDTDPAEHDDEADIRFAGETEEREASTASGSIAGFFEGEESILQGLVVRAHELTAHDRKLAHFSNEVIPAALEHNATGKVLVFTEYRTTQSRLQETLVATYGESAVVLINGSQTIDQKREAIARFEDDADFLVSTEAGGEGLNIHHRCHVVVNYDLPWNPMRLVQRVGRLYRYGQQERVIVINLHAPQTVDANIINLMYQRLDAVVREMSSVSGEFNDRLHDEILGELSSLTDLEDVMSDALDQGVERSKDRIEDALRRARRAKDLQDAVMRTAQGFDPDATRHELRVGPGHLHSFVIGMLKQQRIEIVNSTHEGRVMDLRLREDSPLRERLGRRRFRITTDRAFAGAGASARMMDFANPLFVEFVQIARSHDFGGLTGIATGIPGRALLPALLRWQNDQGAIMRESLDIFCVDADGSVAPSTEAVSKWLESEASDANGFAGSESHREVLDLAESAADEKIGATGGRNLHPLQVRFVSAGWSGVEA